VGVEAVIATQVIDTTSVGRSLMTAVDATAARTNLGLGTLATQSGTFSGTSSGTNTGDQTTVSGNAGSATVLQTARTINGVSFDGSANITVTAAGSTLSDTVTVAKGGTGLTALGTALQVLRVNAGATALEYAAAAGGGIGGATGSTDNSVLRADGTGGATLQSSAWIIADNLTASPNNTVNHACLEATGGTTNVSVSIKPKGTGAFCLAVPDGTSTGGNARGANAVDLQTLRSTAAQVASGSGAIAIGISNTSSGTYTTAIGAACSSTGTYSIAIGYACSASSGIAIGESTSVTSNGYFAIGTSCLATNYGLIALGLSCTASNIHAVAIGRANTASEWNTVALGWESTADRHSQQSYASGKFAVAGDNQAVRFLLRNKTTNTTPTTLFADGSAARITIPSGKILFADVLISGVKSDGSALACYKRKVAIKNVGGTTALVGTVETIGTDIEDSAGCDVAITADNTNDALQINVTGITSETWRWVAVVKGLEIAYGT
jgi:hypothetical protein